MCGLSWVGKGNHRDPCKREASARQAEDAALWALGMVEGPWAKQHHGMVRLRAAKGRQTP